MLAHRLARHWLLTPAPLPDLVRVVGDVCGIHSQMGSAAALSLAARVDGATRVDLRRALEDMRSLVKTQGQRGTIHVYPAAEVGVWLAACSAAVGRDAPGRRLASHRGREAELDRALLRRGSAALDVGPLGREDLRAHL